MVLTPGSGEKSPGIRYVLQRCHKIAIGSLLLKNSTLVELLTGIHYFSLLKS